MDRTAYREPQGLYKGALYLFILNIGTRFTRVGKFKHRPLYPWEGIPLMWRVWVRSWGVYRVLVGKPEGRRPLGRPRRRWVDNIRMDIQEVGCGYMEWIGLAQDRDRWRTLVSTGMNFRVP